jgi:hypothetical protein
MINTLSSSLFDEFLEIDFPDSPEAAAAGLECPQPSGLDPPDNRSSLHFKDPADFKDRKEFVHFAISILESF